MQIDNHGTRGKNYLATKTHHHNFDQNTFKIPLYIY